LKLLTAILTSGNLPLLGRAIDSVKDVDDVVIIVNTLDEDYVKELYRSEISTVYPIVRTESNGLAGKGHQSVIDYFLSTDYTHLIKIDGDDFLLPNGHHKIVETIKRNPSVDVLSSLGDIFRVKVGDQWSIQYCDEMSFSDIVFGTGASVENEVFEWLHRWTSVGGNENFYWDRIVVFSRKGAENTKYSESLWVQSDTQMNCSLKLKAHKGELNYTQLLGRDIYVYDRLFSSASKTVLSDPIELCDKFFERFTEEEQDLLEEYFLPVIVLEDTLDKRNIIDIIKQKDMEFEL